MARHKSKQTKFNFKVTNRLFSFRNDFERQIETEIMHSEILRARFLSGVFALLAATSTGVALFGKSLLEAVHLSSLNPILVALVFMAYAVYEMGFSLAVGQFMRRNLKFPFFPKYFNAFIETSLPSLAIFTLLFFFPSELALTLKYAP